MQNISPLFFSSKISESESLIYSRTCLGHLVLFIEREYIEFIYCQYTPTVWRVITNTLPLWNKNGNTLPRVGMNWKIRPSRQSAPLGPRDCLKGAYFPIHPSSRQCIISRYAVVMPEVCLRYARDTYNNDNAGGKSSKLSNLQNINWCLTLQGVSKNNRGWRFYMWWHLSYESFPKFLEETQSEQKQKQHLVELWSVLR